MANFQGVSRSNFVFVKDVDAALAELGKYGIDVLRHREHPNAIALAGDDDSGTINVVVDDADGEEVYRTLAEWAQTHLVEGQTLILVSAGAEKLRYISAWAQAYTWRGEVVAVNLMETMYAVLKSQAGIDADQVADPSYQEVCTWKPE